MNNNPHIGSDFDDFLKEEGIETAITNVIEQRRGTDASFTYSHMNLKFLWMLGTIQLNRKLSKRLMGKRAPERVKRGQQKRKDLGRVPYFPIHI